MAVVEVHPEPIDVPWTTGFVLDRFSCDTRAAVMNRAESTLRPLARVSPSITCPVSGFRSLLRLTPSSED